MLFLANLLANTLGHWLQSVGPNHISRKDDWTEVQSLPRHTHATVTPLKVEAGRLLGGMISGPESVFACVWCVV